ncbi:hypothetical protein PICMEDRAFT_58645 [Pichia membranifaciens NRRL Y-2026]|uniref:Knr4/Smi1-like domain-containing protein n=1 Tax=Pichia membranifaciens NRRL Y-2026 TaxID=763406 RepID=A0A1E3NJI5_9ASCO|nr:hypothetical protein PICMEDRAFT_58645 [Pichia membranifaciens NRRL Y-2026]ODQ46307.1 hypothetical protein PICMEDRAFT_58645 [Pichia membranifaciens NRRL Y-2026]
MGFLGKKWNELVYTLTSNDRYAGYHSSKAVRSLGTESDDSDAEEAKDTGGVASGYSDQLDESGYSADEKQQAQLVLDAWHIIEDVINLDMKGAADGSNSHFTLNPKNYDFEYEDELDNIDDIPDAEDFLNSLSSPCTVKDLHVAQKHLGVRLPLPVLQYFMVHDGQEIPPSSTRKIGIMYGLQLLSLAEVVTMTNYWRKVSRKESNARYAAQDSFAKEEKQQERALYEKEEKLIDNDPNFQIVKKIDRISEKDLQNYPDLVRNMSTHSKNDYIKKLPDQKSYPPKKVKLQYANPNWIPLVTDNTGNHIAIDLEPDTDGIPGQVIIFGREYDTKYVIADNWGQFMNKFALDFEDAGRCNLDYDSEMGQFDLAYLDKKGEIVDEGYLYVLAQRTLGKDI